jgi:two-component system response regulator DesR
MPSGTDELRRTVPSGLEAAASLPSLTAASIASRPTERSRWVCPGPLFACSSAAVTLALIGGQRLLRDATASLLGAQDGLHVLGAFESVAHFLAVGVEETPAVILLDCDGEGSDGCQSAVAVLSSPYAESRIVLLCREIREEVIGCAIEHGVSGVILKSYSMQDVQATLAYTATGRTVMPAGWQSALVPHRGQLALSPRHRQILALIAEGRRNEEIAAVLDLSPNTIKFHIRALYSRLGVRNRVEAANSANQLAQMTSGGA